MKWYRYDMIGAYYSGIKTHPLEDMQENLGLHILKAEPVTIGDCWIIKTDTIKDNLPSYMIDITDIVKEST